MSFKRLTSWFLSDSGKKFVYCSIAGIGVAAFTAQFIPHTLLLDQYKDVVHLYRNGLTVPLPPILIQRFQKAIKLAEIPEDEVKLYKPFSVFGFDLFHAGSSFSKYGIIVGLPVNFTYTDVDTIEKSNIKVLGESIAWDTDEAKEFLDAMVLSENAQLYAMAREMRMTQVPKLYFDSLYGSICVYVTYAASHFLNNRFNFYSKPLNVRLVLYGLVSTFMYTNYCMITDFTQLYYEKKVDVELKHTNPLFVEGGIEYYDKILKRNRALRKLMGSDGKNVYSILGNEIYWIRQRHLPIVQRKAFFEGSEIKDARMM